MRLCKYKADTYARNSAKNRNKLLTQLATVCMKPLKAIIRTEIAGRRRRATHIAAIHPPFLAHTEVAEPRRKSVVKNTYFSHTNMHELE